MLPSLRKSLLKYCLSSSKHGRGFVPIPPPPTVAESFPKQLPQQQMQIMLDPRGYLTEEQKKEAESKIETVGVMDSTSKAKVAPIEDKQKEKQETVESAKSNYKPKAMEEEYGFKYKGPQPTRFGDWNHKGKCTDFQ